MGSKAAPLTIRLSSKPRMDKVRLFPEDAVFEPQDGEIIRRTEPTVRDLAAFKSVYDGTRFRKYDEDVDRVETPTGLRDSPGPWSEIDEVYGPTKLFKIVREDVLSTRNLREVYDAYKHATIKQEMRFEMNGATSVATLTVIANVHLYTNGSLIIQLEGVSSDPTTEFLTEPVAFRVHSGDKDGDALRNHVRTIYTRSCRDMVTARVFGLQRHLRVHHQASVKILKGCSVRIRSSSKGTA